MMSWAYEEEMEREMMMLNPQFANVTDTQISFDLLIGCIGGITQLQRVPRYQWRDYPWVACNYLSLARDRNRSVHYLKIVLASRVVMFHVPREVKTLKGLFRANHRSLITHSPCQSERLPSQWAGTGSLAPML